MTAPDQPPYRMDPDRYQVLRRRAEKGPVDGATMLNNLALLEDAEDLLSQVAASGVEMDDPCLPYVIVQIDTALWRTLRDQFTPSGNAAEGKTP